MLSITAQVSFYPLRQESLTPSIRAASHVFEAWGLDNETGPMSTLLWGDDDRVFGALHEAFQKVASLGAAVMTVTVSNTCPWPGE